MGGLEFDGQLEIFNPLYIGPFCFKIPRMELLLAQYAD